MTSRHLTKLKLSIKYHLDYFDYIENNERILQEYKCIFIHIPKTGGTTISNALKSLPLKSSNIIPFMHKHAKAFEVKCILGKKIWEKYFTFAFVRNPWDLMVSSYHWWLQKAYQFKHLLDYANKVKDLGNFSNFIYSKYGQEMLNEQEGDIIDWISDGNDIIVDFIGRFENLQEDWNKVCKEINVTSIDLSHMNKTERRDYREYYTNETKELIAQRFHKTIEHFGYEF